MHHTLAFPCQGRWICRRQKRKGSKINYNLYLICLLYQQIKLLSTGFFSIFQKNIGILSIYEMIKIVYNINNKSDLIWVYLVKLCKKTKNE